MGLFKSKIDKQREQQHIGRVNMVRHLIPMGAKFYDSGVARADAVPGIPRPKVSGDVVFGGYIVIVDDRFIYSDRQANEAAFKFEFVEAVSKYRSDLPDAIGLEIEYSSGDTLRFSGASAFMLKFYDLLKDVSQVNAKYTKVLKTGIDEIFSALEPHVMKNVSQSPVSRVSSVQKSNSLQNKTPKSTRVRYQGLILEAAVEVKDFRFHKFETIEHAPAWLLLWDSLEIDLLPKGNFSRIEDALKKVKLSDFYSVVSARSKREIKLSNDGVMTVVVGGAVTYQLSLAPKTVKNFDEAKRLIRNSHK